jgi:hypothetical protein
METNVGKIERWGSLVGGGALLAYTLTRRRRLSPLSGSLALGAATLLFRGATGHCPAYGALGLNTADLADDWARPLSRSAQQEDKEGETGDKTFRGKWPLPEGARLVQPGDRDLVDDASAHSFPASDPPALTPTEVG